MSNMKSYSIYILFAFVFCNATKVQAQTGSDDIEQEEITVIGNYKPHLADAVKINPGPTLPEITSDSVGALNYNVPISFAPLPWSPASVRPVAIGKQTLAPLQNVFAKAGFGTQFSPLLEVAYSSGRSEQFNYGLRGKYTSANGSLENQLFTHGSGDLFAKYFAGDVAIGLRASLQNEVLHYYGYDHEDTSFAREDVKQRFLVVGGHLDLSNTKINDFGVDWGVDGGVYFQNDFNKFSEINPYLNGTLSYILNSKDQIRVKLGFENLNYKGPIDQSRTIVRLGTAYRFLRDDWYFNAGAQIAVDSGNVNFYPDLEFSRELLGEELVFFIGWNMRLETNSWRSMAAKNPYLADSITFLNTRLEDRFFGFRGKTGGKFDYKVRLSQKLGKDFVFYVTDSLDTKRFQPVYTDDVTLLAAHLEAGYLYGDKLRIFGSAEFRNFNKTGDQPRAWHEPSLIWNIGGTYKFNDKLSISSSIIGQSATWAKLPVPQADGTNEIELKGTADINVGATYAYNKYFTIWLDVNNLAAIKHQQWYQYPSYGFQVKGGLQFSF
ncbi:MAG: hypothetical protein ACI959_001362 [Limisphaerales bacterium]|jgi:hypothetical protein